MNIEAYIQYWWFLFEQTCRNKNEEQGREEIDMLSLALLKVV
jgi:hypothetical protein